MTRPLRRLLALFSIAVSAALVAILVTRAPLHRVAQVLASAEPLGLALAGLFYLGTYFARAKRLRLLARRSGTARLFGVVALHTASLRIVPLRLGDLSYPFFAARFAGEDVARSAIVLVHLRLLDVIVLLPALAVAALTFGATLKGGRFLALVAIGLFGAALIAVTRLASAARLIARLLARLRRGAAMGTRLRAAAEDWDGLAPGAIVGATLWSLAVWGSMFGAMGSIARACGITVGIAQIVASGTLSLAASAVPLSVGTIGFLESGWALGLVLCGAPTERAIASGLVFQWGTLALSLASAAVSYGWLRARCDDGS